MFVADLGTGDGSGGNVHDRHDRRKRHGYRWKRRIFEFEHTEHPGSASNVVFLGSLQNDGSGAINVVAGWDGTTLDPAQFTSALVFRNNSGSIVLGGDQAFGNVAVGSAGGMTTLAASDINLLANNGYAQIGYFHGVRQRQHHD